MWKIAALKSLKAFLYVVALLAMWVVAERFELLPNEWIDIGKLILGLSLFILGLPLSLLFRVDVLRHYGFANSDLAVLTIASSVVLLNFLLINGLRGYFGKRSNSEKTDKRVSHLD
ncbi:MAG: hypothetical protein IT291_10015 [Deltaproteobacteria bacterium]|nr:hypothetical protein [Deltaproteobacteria bacterium]